MQGGVTVPPDEPLARFLFSSGLYSRQKQLVKPGAFLPPPDLKLSMFRTGGLTEPDVRKLGETAQGDGPRTLHGHASLAAAAVTESGLALDPDDSPPRHVNIMGWPPNDKDRQKLAAIELARRASLTLYNGKQPEDVGS